MKKNILLIIDPQNDFCHPEGSLYVKGADDDMSRLSKWVVDNREKIDDIIVSFDTHNIIDISHPLFWKNKEDKNIKPFTNISSNDVRNGEYIPLCFIGEAIEYLEKLEKQDKTHTIWPEHCIVGSWGNNLYKSIKDMLCFWREHFNNKPYKTLIKGTCPTTEHFGIFKACVPNQEYIETQLNRELLLSLLEYDNIIIGGEAKSHCVGETIQQMIDFEENQLPKDFENKLMKKVLILEDCMSDVKGFEEFADKTFENAKKLGAEIVISEKYNLS